MQRHIGGGDGLLLFVVVMIAVEIYTHIGTHTHTHVYTGKDNKRKQTTNQPTNEPSDQVNTTEIKKISSFHEHRCNVLLTATGRTFVLPSINV